MPADLHYSIDSSSLIHGWTRAYPITVPMFAPVWDLLGALIQRGQLRATREVRHEVEKRDDGLTKWCKGHPQFFVDIDILIQEKVKDVLKRYPRLIDTRKGRSGADPFVIAYALLGNPYHTVVTEEQGGTPDKPMIPSVCRSMGVRSINLLELIKEN